MATSNGDLTASFREKANYMKSWKPSSSPSNRDRLELYALHKQAISGDAPNTLVTSTIGDTAKFTAWRGKAGMSKEEAMRQYMQEADRQIRVYGGTATTPLNTPTLEQPPATATAQQPRGLAAIPLLCAAASESRTSYLRRLANTQPEQAWWKRQEPLCATPRTFLALPEAALIFIASVIESISLNCESVVPIPAPVVQSLLWPTHNCLLSLWMGLILVFTAWTAALELTQTIIWGSRRTGHTLVGIWKDEVRWSAQSVQILTESHQPLSARIVGLAILPYTILVGLASQFPYGLGQSAAYVAFLSITWWYWMIALPWMAIMVLGMATMTGSCFALIELAGV